MASPRTTVTTPLTFELPRTLVVQIQSLRGRYGLKSASDVVRRALEEFDFSAFRAPPRDQCQISVRLPPARKRSLFHTARRHKVSAGELLRAALEAFSPRVARPGNGARRRNSRRR